MAIHRSAQEVEADRIAVLGPDLGPLFHALDNEVCWLHTTWKEFRQLYSSPSTVDLLNQTAPFFFRVVQDALWHDALLQVARLTDPPVSAGKARKANLTLRRLPAALPPGTLQVEVDALVSKVLSEAAFARDWRNRRLAHRDLGVALGGAQPLAEASRQHIENVLSSMRNVMNALHHHYWNSSTAYDTPISNNNAESLLLHLRVARKAEAKRHDRWNRGVVLPEDLEKDDEV
jgi:hypothetical protein